MLLDVHSLCLCAAVGKLFMCVCVFVYARVLCILDYYCISECL